MSTDLAENFLQGGGVVVNRFEKEVRKALIDRDMNLKDLAKQLQISLPYLYDILNSNRPGKEQKKKMVEILELQPSIIE
jgi:predicted transcriptional regulator